MTAQYFFSHLQDIPPDAGISAWGAVHVGWLVCIVAACVLLVPRYRRMSGASRVRLLRGLATAIWVQEIAKNLLHWRAGALGPEHLPLHLCGISMFVCLAYAVRQHRMLSQALYALVIPGAVMALVFLDWTQYPALHFSSLTSFSIHGCLVLFGVLAVSSGEARPDWRALPRLYGCTLLAAGLVYPLNKWLGTNFFFVNTPSPGSPLMPMARLLGNPGYIGGMAVLLLLLWAVIYTPWTLADRRARHSIDG